MNNDETDAATETMEGTVAEEDESTNMNDEVYDSRVWLHKWVQPEFKNQEMRMMTIIIWNV